MNEIKVSAPTVVYEPAKVIYDFTELDNEIAEIKKRFQNWLPSEDEIKDAEKVAKEINGVATNLNSEKVRIKKEMNAESKKFEDETMLRVNSLKSIRQSVLDSIEAYDQERIKTRTEDFARYVEEYCKEIDFEIPYNVVIESKVTTKSCTEKQWKEIAKANIDGHKLNYDLLAQMDVEDKVLLQAIYMQKWDRLDAIDEYNAQMEAKKKAEKLKQKDNGLKGTKSHIETDMPCFDRPEPIINEMVSINGNVEAYNKAKGYALSLGLLWQEI